MDYNFRGQYDSTKNYAKKDVVSYQASVNSAIKFHFCLTDHTNTTPHAPSPSVDTAHWGALNTSSNFPNDVDSFMYRSTIQANDKVDIERINELTLKPNLPVAEQDELNMLIQKHRNKLLLSDDINAIQQSISNLQMFYKDKVDSKLNENITVINSSKDSALKAIDEKKNNIIEYMDGTTAGALRNDIGVMGDLTTTNKTSLVSAVNEINAKDVDLTPINDKIGLLSKLKTTAKTNLVAAINEVSTDITTHMTDYVANPPFIEMSYSENGKLWATSPYVGINNWGELPRGAGLNFHFIHSGRWNIPTSVALAGLEGLKPLLKTNGTPVKNLDIDSIYTFRWNGSAFILQGEGGEYGNAEAPQVLSGYTVGRDSGVIPGTMINNGVIQQNITTQFGMFTIPEGYHSGTGAVWANIPNLVPENVKSGINVGGVVGIVLTPVYIYLPGTKVSYSLAPLLLRRFRVDASQKVKVTTQFYSAVQGNKVNYKMTKNGVAILETFTRDGPSFPTNTTDTIDCMAGDVFDIYGWIDDATNPNTALAHSHLLIESLTPASPTGGAILIN